MIRQCFRPKVPKVPTWHFFWVLGPFGPKRRTSGAPKKWRKISKNPKKCQKTISLHPKDVEKNFFDRFFFFFCVPDRGWTTVRSQNTVRTPFFKHDGSENRNFLSIFQKKIPYRYRDFLFLPVHILTPSESHLYARNACFDGFF